MKKSESYVTDIWISWVEKIKVKLPLSTISSVNSKVGSVPKIVTEIWKLIKLINRFTILVDASQTQFVSGDVTLKFKASFSQ